MSTQGERLRQAIELAGFTKVAPFAESIGEKAITVRQHINRESIPMRVVEKYVRALRPFGVTTDWLLHAKGPPPKGVKELRTVVRHDRPAASLVEITHVVGAGDQVYPVPGDSPLGYITAPPGYEAGGAVAIRGDSMAPLYCDQDLLFYRGWEAPPSHRRIPDRPVLIELSNGRSLLKRLLPGSKAGRFHLSSLNVSTPVILDVTVRTIARIGWAYFGGLGDASVAGE